MKRLLLVIVVLFLVLACGSTGTSIPIPEYRLIGTQGEFNAFVVVEKGISTDKAALQRIGEEICKGHPICNILFWDYRNKAASEIPMTDAQANDLVANYARNENTNFSQMLICIQGECN